MNYNYTIFTSYIYIIKDMLLQHTSSNSLRFNGHFPGEPRLAGVY